MTHYEPEIGQALFGQPSQEYECPEILDAALQSIQRELHRVLWNLRHFGELDPFGNTGDYFDCDTFTVEAYSWAEDSGQAFNFLDKKSGLKLSWYKYFGRGMSCDREVTPDFASDVLVRCLTALRKIEAGDVPYSVERPSNPNTNAA